MQGDHGLARTRAAVDDEGAAGTRADDRVLVGRDGAEHVAHPGRAAAAQAGDEGGLVVEGGVPVQPVRSEHLVPVVADPAAGPAVPAAACQAHRVGVRRSEERLSRGRAPVKQQPAARAVGEAKPPDVHGLGIVRADDAPEAQVQAETTQDAQAGAQPVDLHIPVHRRLAHAAWRPALGVKAAGQVGDRLLEALRDGREVLLVAGDQRGVGLGGQAGGKVKRASSQEVHRISSDLSSLAAVGAARRPGRPDEPGGQDEHRSARRRPHGAVGTGHRGLQVPLGPCSTIPRGSRGYCRPSRLTASASSVARTRICAPTVRNPAASPAIGSTSPRDPFVGNNTRTSRPHFRRLWPRPAIMRHDPGLAASPPVRYILKVEGSAYPPFFNGPLWTGNPPCRVKITS